ncbi:malonic semialdehyde reductase [Paracraurococcus ruber]|uniref:Putative NADH dehydrogenase/NAD(P)H nitroreductase CKO45_30655 n=1 Tax=Paracraurococcus ruber TaxID=77675 RepID=A0ABS1D8J3_9PROT|nr:malonic semialdehyde reductase [Paracraurococcus ruber]MBK1662542.1 malonic semialdehyde reductase [Paracraurococcus ruber]TDG10174.1 malonic semialdehyde reductase [Paracraurococcus ruber]
MTTDPSTLDDAARDLLFRNARTHYAWQDRPVPDTKLQELYDLLKWAPTSANSSPARFVFIRTKEGKDKLRPALSAGNVEATMAAPVTVIVATDSKFYDRLPTLYPQADVRTWFADNWSLADQTATRNGTLQGAYLILAARAVGLDCAPMSGFDNWKVDEAFLTGTDWRSNFLVNLGHGDPAGLPARNPRLTFDEACRLE